MGIEFGGRGHTNTTFSASSGVAPEDAVFLLDKVPTQDDVLPPLCIFSAHSVEDRTPTLLAYSYMQPPRGAQLFLLLFLNTRLYVLQEYGEVRVVKRTPVQPSYREIQMVPKRSLEKALWVT